MSSDQFSAGVNKRLSFGLIGHGAISRYHINAIQELGGYIQWIYDPENGYPKHPDKRVDYVVICSPSHLHRTHILKSLSSWGDRVICEKPYKLPWEPDIVKNDDRINVVLQYRHLPKKFLLEGATSVEVDFVRDTDYFKSWKGNPKYTGGIFYNLFIHYIDLAQTLKCSFFGRVWDQSKHPEKSQVRKIKINWKPSVKSVDLFTVDMKILYTRMYSDIIKGRGTHPSDLFYLNWLMDRYQTSMGESILNTRITIPYKLP